MKKKLLSLFAALAMAATVSAEVTYTCTAGTKFGEGEGVTKLFDGDQGTKFCGGAGDNTYALFTASEPVYVWAYDMTTANDNEAYGRCVKKWTLYGTNDATVAANADAEGWVTLSDLGRNNFVQQKNFYTQRFFCEKGVSDPFKYFKVVFNESPEYEENEEKKYDGLIQLSEFKLLAEPNRVTTYKWKASSSDNSKKALDLLLNEKWEGSNIAGNWVTIETGDGQAYAVKSYSFTTHDDGDWNNRAPKSWKIEGSNDNSEWTLIDEVVDDTKIQNANYTTFEFTPSNTTDKFRYIKLTLVAMMGTGWTQVGEFHVLSTSDVSDAEYHTNLVNNAKANKAEFESILGADDPWCQEYNTFFEGLNLDAVLEAAISSGDYTALEAALAEAENNAIAKAMKQFVNGANCAAVAGSACWGDAHYSQLVDGKENTKWGGNFDGSNPQYVIYRVKKAFAPFFYKLVTGNDTANNTGRNWKTWSVYGANFASFGAATLDAEGWTLLDERVDVSEEYLPMKNFYPATFDFNKGVSEDYLYYMVKVIAPHNGNQQQMSEMYLCTQEDFEAIRQPLVDELAEFAATVADLEVESDLVADKETFVTLYEELKTTSDAVRLTKVYNDLVALKDKLEDSAAFVAGGYRVLEGNTAWGDGENWTKLLDGNEATKWGGGIPEGGSYVIFKTYEAKTFGVYKLITGNDTKNSPDRNWKDWKIYGVAGKVSDANATRDLTGWTLIDQKENVGQDQLPGENFAPAFFSFSEEWTKAYKYFKIEVSAAYNGGGSIQMSEFKMLSDEEWQAARQEYVDALTAQKDELYADQEIAPEVEEMIAAAIAGVANAEPGELLVKFADAKEIIAGSQKQNFLAKYKLTEINGVLQLGTAEDVVNFAKVINDGTEKSENTFIDAVLTDDIDLSGVIPAEGWDPIGNWGAVSYGNACYKGHFDGQGYSITGFNTVTPVNNFGFFGVISTGALIENFSIYGTITNSIKTGGAIGFARDDNPTIRNVNSYLTINNTSVGARLGGILGTSYSNSTVNVEGCTYSGVLDGNDNAGNGNYGGIVGYTQNANTSILNVTDCLFDGKLINTTATPGGCTFGGIVGYIGAGPLVTATNCLSVGTVQSQVYGQFFGAVKNTTCSIINSYYKGDKVNGSASTVELPLQEATQVTDEQLASGEVAIALGYAFRQNVGEDAYPVLDKTHGIVKEITEAGYATMYIGTSVKVPAGVEASTGSINSETQKLTLNPVDGVVPAWEPVVLKGAAGFYSFQPTASLEDDTYVDFSAYGMENAEPLTNTTIKAGGLSINFDKGAGTTDPAYYTSGEAVRLFGSNTMTITATRPIVKIVFIFGSGVAADTPAGKSVFSEGSYNAETYTWTGSAETVTLTREAGRGHYRIIGMIVTENAGAIYNIADNVLKGTDEDIDAAGKYILAKPANEPAGFYKATSGTIKGGKAYLELPEGSDIKAFYFEDENATGISAVENNLNENGVIYNLAGQRMSKMQKGINIINGKKVLVK